MVAESEKVQQILGWMLDGNSELLIRDAIEKTWPGENADPLIVKTLKQMHRSADLMRERIKDWSIEALRHLYQKQVEIGEFAGAMRAVAELRKLTESASTAKEKTERSTEDFPRVLNVDARKRELAERIARLG